MSKQQQLIEYLLQDIIEMITNDENTDYDVSMEHFYSSEIFEKLQDTETGLYLQSPAYIYDLYKDECNFGHIVQAEI